jgi:hypothetical protein
MKSVMEAEIVPNCRYVCSRLHRATSQNAALFMFATVRPPGLACMVAICSGLTWLCVYERCGLQTERRPKLYETKFCHYSFQIGVYFIILYYPIRWSFHFQISMHAAIVLLRPCIHTWRAYMWHLVTVFSLCHKNKINTGNYYLYSVTIIESSQFCLLHMWACIFSDRSNIWYKSRQHPIRVCTVWYTRTSLASVIIAYESIQPVLGFKEEEGWQLAVL